jgi:hypothetical protein
MCVCTNAYTQKVRDVSVHTCTNAFTHLSHSLPLSRSLSLPPSLHPSIQRESESESKRDRETERKKESAREREGDSTYHMMYMHSGTIDPRLEFLVVIRQLWQFQILGH